MSDELPTHGLKANREAPAMTTPNGSYPDVADLGRANRAFHDALRKYPDAFEALHYFWNEGIAGVAQASQDLEAVAAAIYEKMPHDGRGHKPPWTPRGNSFKQDEARMYAKAALSALSSTKCAVTVCTCRPGPCAFPSTEGKG